MTAIRLGLAGDTMLGRGVAAHLETNPPRSLFSAEVVAAARRADLVVANLECCVSERGAPWPDPRKPFFFRAPPVALEALTLLGVDCVSLANNHALDFGYDALLDTFEHLEAAGVGWVGAGRNLEEARRPAVLEANGFRIAVVAFSDHPRDFAAAADRPGIAFVDLRGEGVPAWVVDAIRSTASDVDAVLVTPHWGPNMTRDPLPQVRAAAGALLAAGATLVAGHSAHVFQGVEGRVLYDLGDFLDDYAVDRDLRNDLGLLWLVCLTREGPAGIDALPLKLDYCRTRVAVGDDAAWIRRRVGTMPNDGVRVVREASL